jgi:PAS domain S-box-containing protein
LTDKPLRILVVEDDPAHVALIKRAFRPFASEYALTVAATLAQARQLVTESLPDLVLADLFLPDGLGTELLHEHEDDARFPVVIMTAQGREEAAVEAMKAGAVDYVGKSGDAFRGMPRTVDRALREWKLIFGQRRAVEALRQSEERFRAIFESATDWIFIKDSDLNYTLVNPAMERFLGIPASRIVGRSPEEVFGPEIGKRIRERDSRVLAGEPVEVEQAKVLHGVTYVFQDTLVPLKDSRQRIIGICGICRNITERKRLTEPPLTLADHWRSEAMMVTIDRARLAAETDSIILLEGESGSGKDYLARWIHDRSRRASGPFFSINCAAVSSELAESELFGHERGAFTGAVGLKRGMLELAEGGTILLNEIGELDLSIQSKLLVFLDTKSFLRVGGQKPVHVNARLIAATHRDLERERLDGRFLDPLFFRLSVFPIRVPPLRDRIEDIPILAREILGKLAAEMQLNDLPGLDAGHMEELSRYLWPGNVRELRNVLERSLILWRGGRFRLASPAVKLGSEHRSYPVPYVPGKTLRAVTDEVTKAVCTEVLRQCRGNKKEAARVLDISRDALYRYIRRMGIKSDNMTRT